MVRRIAVVALGSVVVGCAQHTTLEADAALDASSTVADARSDAAVTARRQPPTRPGVADGADGPEIVFGLRDVLLDQGAEARNVGFDLDGYDTTSRDPLTECSTDGPTLADGAAGIDNVFGAELYPLIESVVPGLQERTHQQQLEGRGLVILRLRGWNGARDDPRVDVAVMRAVFSTTADGPTPDVPPEVTIRSPTDVELAGGGPLPLPEWDGDDWTWIGEDTLLGGDVEQPLMRDDDAYVADGAVVARLPARIDLVLSTDGGGMLVRLTDGVLVASLGTDGHLEAATVAGRWSVTDLLATAESLGVCPGTGQFEILAAQLDRIADVMSVPPATGAPDLRCDAVSVGITFSGTRVRVAGVTPGAPLASACTP